MCLIPTIRRVRRTIPRGYVQKEFAIEEVLFNGIDYQEEDSVYERDIQILEEEFF